MLRLTIAAFALFALSACGSAPKPFYGKGTIPTFYEGDAAFEWAAANNHLVAVFFTSSSCAACWTFESDVLGPMIAASGGDVAVVRVDFPGIPLGGVGEFFDNLEREDLDDTYRAGRRGLPDVVLVDPVTRKAVTSVASPSDAGSFAVFLEHGHEVAGTMRAQSR